jgi:phage shock protein C
MSRRKPLYRNPENARIAGVCSGLAEHFGIEVWLVRILTVTSFFFLAPPFVFVSYIAGWFILDKKPNDLSVDTTATVSLHSGKGWRNGTSTIDNNGPVALKTKVWQAGEPPKQAFYDIKDRFAAAEQRLRSIETYVTSKEFQLKREISRL